MKTQYVNANVIGMICLLTVWAARVAHAPRLDGSLQSAHAGRDQRGNRRHRRRRHADRHKGLLVAVRKAARYRHRNVHGAGHGRRVHSSRTRPADRART